MIKVLTIAVAAAMCVLPTQAARVVETFAEGQSVVQDAGFMVFIYPGDWDRYGERLCRSLMADRGVRRAAGDAVMLALPIYQRPSDEMREAANRIRGSLSYPHDMSDISYPAILFYEKEGRHYATIQGTDLMNATPARVAQLVAARMTAKRNQDDILRRSRESQDVSEQARLLLESSRVSGIDWPGGLREAIKRVDPEDTQGVLAALNFNLGGPRQNETLADYLARLDSALENPLISPEAKQRACAAVIGHVRRSLGMMGGAQYIRKYAGIMRSLNPESPLGLAAPVVLRDWVQEYRYGQGWNPDTIPGQAVPLQMTGAPINAAGTYVVNFQITTGRDPLFISSVKLYDGERLVAADEHESAVTYAAPNQRYKLEVSRAVRNPVLEFIFTNRTDNRSSYGNITVEKQ